MGWEGKTTTTSTRFLVLILVMLWMCRSDLDYGFWSLFFHVRAINIIPTRQSLPVFVLQNCPEDLQLGFTRFPKLVSHLETMDIVLISYLIFILLALPIKPLYIIDFKNLVACLQFSNFDSLNSFNIIDSGFNIFVNFLSRTLI